MSFKKKFEIKKTIINAQKSSKNRLTQSCFYFTDRKKCADLNQVFKNLPKNSCIIFREYDLSKHDRKLMALDLIKLARKFKLKFIIGKDLELAKQVKADGVHYSDLDFSGRDFSDLDFSGRNFFSQHHLQSLIAIRQNCQKNNLIFSLAIHKLRNILQAKKYRADIIFLSPIFATSSHENSCPIGFYNFVKIQKIYLKKFNDLHQQKNLLGLFPLGGINTFNLNRLNSIKIKGFGAIDFFKNL